MQDWLDRRAARRWFERTGGAPVPADPLAREVERRMVERLDYVRHAPARALQVGCATAGVQALRRRYPEAGIVVADRAMAPLRRARGARPLGARARSLLGAGREHFVAGEIGALPIASASVGLVWSNLSLAWAGDLVATLREWHRVLEVGGLLMFSTYGPDTLKELRAAFEGDAPHVHPFADMHDIGDALVAGGFADPVMDMEMITLTYAGVDRLLADLRATGQRNAHAARRRTLTGKQRWRRALAAYPRQADASRVNATFEIVYGHAWKAAPRLAADGRAIIRFNRTGAFGKSG
jgi:malonyl-CoA O-methyltransferase